MLLQSLLLHFLLDSRLFLCLKCLSPKSLNPQMFVYDEMTTINELNPVICCLEFHANKLLFRQLLMFCGFLILTRDNVICIRVVYL